MRTSGPDVTKAFVRPALTLLCVVALASCTSGEPEAKSEHPCGISPSSEEGVLLKGILRAEGGEALVHNSTNDVAEAMRNALPKPDPEGTKTECAVWAAGQNGGDRVTFSFGWVSRGSKPLEQPLPDGVPFEAGGGAFGQANDTDTGLFVGCEMPAELAGPSKSVWFHAQTSHNFNPPWTDIDRTVRDAQTAFTSLVARRVTEALGCKNEPLARPPVVTPLPTP